MADINNDGNRDIVLVPAEEKGQRYHIAWFEVPEDYKSDWIEHIVDTDVEAVHHFVAARDTDNDGDIDILSAEMNQSDDPDEIKVYINESSGNKWKKQLIENSGSHSMRAINIDNDFDIDLFGTHWNKTNDTGDNPVELWENQTSQKEKWKRHVIDNNRPWKSVFIFAVDINQDSHMDIVSGGWWYRNPVSSITGGVALPSEKVPTMSL